MTNMEPGQDKLPTALPGFRHSDGTTVCAGAMLTDGSRFWCSVCDWQTDVERFMVSMRRPADGVLE